MGAGRPLARDERPRRCERSAIERCARPWTTRRTRRSSLDVTNEAPVAASPASSCTSRRRRGACAPTIPAGPWRRTVGTRAAQVGRAAVRRARRDRHHGLHRVVRGTGLGERPGGARQPPDRGACEACSPASRCRTRARRGGSRRTPWRRHRRMQYQARLLERRILGLRAEPGSAASSSDAARLRFTADFVGGSIASASRPAAAPGLTRRVSTTSRAGRSRRSPRCGGRSPAAEEWPSAGLR